MNKSLVWGLLCLILTLSQTSFAQDCAERVAVAKDYMEIVDSLSPEIKEQLRQNILPCISDNNQDALLIEAILILSNNPTEQQERISFATIKRSAESGETIAYKQLATLYKQGIGTQVNLKESKRWYDLAANEGDSFAQYALGYYQMKGLAGEQQDYQAARNSFQSSTYPMANHWSAVMDYFGYGTTANPTKALSILDANGIKNSEILAAFLRTEQGNPEPTISTQELNLINSFDDAIETITFDDINKRFEAKIVELDWKEEKVKRVEDVKFSFSAASSGLVYDIEIAGTILQGNATYGAENTMTLEGVSFPIKRLYKDSDNDNVTYTVKDIKFDLIPIGDITYVVGKINADIVDFKESSPPLFVILKPLPPLPPDVNFHISPNPSKRNTFLYYTLDKAYETYFEIFDFAGLLRYSSPKVMKPEGSQTVYLDSRGLGLRTGIYFVILHTNEHQHQASLIIK
ncbi:T9SS type A sorting domain-containing protein [Aquimarina algiphila]|uniref:T9SS type A sorting domain-containing protein n=1 Tax=Aquimarina algiphila TaxID=2047982 RepID=UPI00232B6A45|nr:T9SS type A sorting domain-containing protein [Aquimarina algiphila]